MPFRSPDDPLSIEVLALRATVRALVRVQGRRSPEALTELILALAEETGRLSEDIANFDAVGREEANRAGGLVAEIISELTDEAKAA